MDIQSDPNSNAASPSAVRSQVLAQHRELRKLLRGIEDLARRVLSGETGAGMELRRQAVELEAFLSRHLAFEERLLVPLLRTIDSWGPAREEEIAVDHARQRSVLEETVDRATSAALTACEVAEIMQELVRDLVVDMGREEREMLHPDLLRDDLVVIDQDGG